MTRRVLVLGTGTLAHAACEGLLAGGCAPVAVMSSREAARRSRRSDPLVAALPVLLRRARIEHLDRVDPDRPAFRDLLARLAADCVLMAGWGGILRPALLAMPGVDFLNLHPSALPAHRGPNPHAAVIRAGDAESGVSIHRVDAGIDTGPVLLRETLPVLPEDTGGSLRDRAGVVARGLATRLAALLAAGPLPPGTPQQALGTASRHHRMREHEAWLEWRWPAARLEREVRALQPWLTPAARLPAGGRWQLRIRFTRVLAAATPLEVLAPGAICRAGEAWPSVHCGTPDTVLHLAEFGVALGGRELPSAIARRLARRLLAPGACLPPPARPDAARDGPGGADPLGS